MSDLLSRAKEIKNATEIGENTAERVGGVMVDTINAITSLQERAVLHEDSLTTQGKQIATLQTKVQDVIYTNQDQQGAINAQAAGLTEAERRIQEHTTQIGVLQQTIRDLTARIEELEKGGSSSADVESGTLSASASVANEVMSVQGSVVDGILKL